MIFFRKSLGRQLLAGFLILSIIPPSIIGIISYNSGRERIISNVQIHLESVAILKKQAIKEWAEHLQHSLSWLANDPQVMENSLALTRSLSSQTNHSAEYLSLAAQFRRLVSLGPTSQVFLLDPLTGQIIVSSNPLWEGKVRKNDRFFINGKKGFYISEMFLSLSMGRPTMVISGPITDSHGNLIGVIAAHADFNKLSQIMLNRTGLSQTTEIFLVNKSNLLITNTVFAPEGAFKKWIFGEGAKWALKGKSGVDLFFDYRNVQVLGAYLWLEDRKLALIVKQDASEAFAPISILRNKILAIVISVAVLVFWVSFLFAGRITKPLQKLVEGASAIGHGNLDYRIKTQVQDEIGVLSHAFDDMAKNLKALSISRDEKEVLLREIHHRVKNNMQVIVSLLSLQAEKVKEEKFTRMLKESQNRINAMSLVHEKLYKSHDLANIDFGEYVKSFVDTLAVSHGIGAGKVAINTRIEDISFDLENAIPCGLVINELVSNSLKYAFPGDRKGEVQVILNSINKKDLELIIKDNGIGLSKNFDFDNIETLGLSLTRTIVEHQLDGEIEIDRTNGTAFCITFKRQKYKARI